MSATVNFAQIVKKTTCLMRTTEYNSNNCLTPEFKWTSFEKRNNLDELINIPTKAEEKSMIQILFRTQDPNTRQAQSRIRVKNYSWSTIHCVFKIRQLQTARLTAKSTIRALFKAKSVDPKTYSPPSKKYVTPRWNLLPVSQKHNRGGCLS